MADLFSAFKETRGGLGVLLTLAAGQVTLIQSYAIVEYFVESYLGPRHKEAPI